MAHERKKMARKDLTYNGLSAKNGPWEENSVFEKVVFKNGTRDFLTSKNGPRPKVFEKHCSITTGYLYFRENRVATQNHPVPQHVDSSCFLFFPEVECDSSPSNTIGTASGRSFRRPSMRWLSYWASSKCLWNMFQNAPIIIEIILINVHITTSQSNMQYPQSVILYLVSRLIQ